MIFSKVFGKNSDQLVKEAINDYKDGKDEFAVIEKLQTALKNGVKNYPLDEVYLYIGSAYYDLSLYEKSAEAYEKGLEYNSKNHSLLSNLGITYQKTGDPEKSYKYYKASLEIKPDNSFAHHNIGFYHFDNGNHFEAIEYINNALRLNPSLANSYSIKARSLAYLGLYKEAEIVFKEAVKQGYDNPNELKLYIETIKKDNPLIYWNSKKTYDLIKVIPLNSSCIDQLVLIQKKPYEFYLNNKQIFEDNAYSAFEINNALHWHFIIHELSKTDRIVIIDYTDESMNILAKIKKTLIANNININDSLDEFENEFVYADDEDTLLAIAAKLKITNSVELINIWTSDYSLNLIPMLFVYLHLVNQLICRFQPFHHWLHFVILIYLQYHHQHFQQYLYY